MNLENVFDWFKLSGVLLFLFIIWFIFKKLSNWLKNKGIGF